MVGVCPITDKTSLKVLLKLMDSLNINVFCGKRHVKKGKGRALNSGGGGFRSSEIRKYDIFEVGNPGRDLGVRRYSEDTCRCFNFTKKRTVRQITVK